MEITEKDIGKKVWSTLDGWGEIIKLIDDDGCGVLVKVKFPCSNYEEFSLDGRLFSTHKFPCIYWQEMELVEKKMPARQALYVDGCNQYVVSRQYFYNESAFEEYHKSIKDIKFVKFLDHYVEDE